MTNNRQLMKNIEISTAIKLEELVNYEEGQVISRTLAQTPYVSITLFALDKGEGISAHTTPGDAMVQVLDGEAEIIIGETSVPAMAGETVIMPANVPHALEARNSFKMLLTVVKETD